MEKLRSVHSLTLSDRVKNQTERGGRTPVTLKPTAEFRVMNVDLRDGLNHLCVPR